MFAFVNLIVLIKFLLLDIKMHLNKYDYIHKKALQSKKCKFCKKPLRKKLGLKMDPPPKIYEIGTTFQVWLRNLGLGQFSTNIKVKITNQYQFC